MFTTHFVQVIRAAADYLVSQLVPADEFVIAIDVSGSITFRATNERLAAVFNAIMRQTNVESVRVLTFAAEIVENVVFHRGQAPEMPSLTLLGAGGSNVEPILKQVGAKATVIFITDGFLPPILPNCNVGWLLSVDHSPLSVFNPPGPSVYELDDRYLLLGNGPNLWEAA